MIEVPTSVSSLFVEAGWHPGRRVSVDPSVPASHPAAPILAQFAGLTVGDTGTGEECARSDLAFRQLCPDDPIVSTWEELLHTQLFGVADVHHAHGELYVDSSGRCFGRSCIHDAFYFEGASFAEAVERLLLGRRSRPMLRPGQETVRLYGEVFTANHPSVYQYR